jgi:hypothetical protein
LTKIFKGNKTRITRADFIKNYYIDYFLWFNRLNNEENRAFIFKDSLFAG